ncbi:MAG: cobalt-precorrin-6A reductase [Cyanobacteria bacterium P01_G01_bin.19]
MKPKVWLIGGTQDSAKIAESLSTNDVSSIVSVVSQEARALYNPDIQVLTGCMDRNQMQSFCRAQDITTIIDASHPFAVEVSRSAIAIAKKLAIPYLRYERSKYLEPKAVRTNSSVLELPDLKTLLAKNYLENQRVLLTLGCKTLPQFKPWQDKSRLYARVLPKIESLKIAIDAGFTSERLIAIRPPLNFALEKALWQQWDISLVVTKASGNPGGEDIKRQAAADLNIPLIIINRPSVPYPRQTSLISDVLAFCRQGRG